MYAVPLGTAAPIASFVQWSEPRMAHSPVTDRFKRDISFKFSFYLDDYDHLSFIPHQKVSSLSRNLSVIGIACIILGHSEYFRRTKSP